MSKMLMELPSRLETERLILRCYQPGDAALYFAACLRNHAHLQRFESGNSMLSIHSLEEAETLLRELASAWAARRYFLMGAFKKTTEHFVAQVYVGAVSWSLPEFEIGYVADVDHEGQGYVTEAVMAALRFVFHDLQAQRATIHCSDQNRRSARVAERCGFTREGHIRENKKLADGSFEGELIYGLLKREYEAVKDE